MGLYLRDNEVVKFLRQTDEFTDFSFEEHEPKIKDLMFNMGVISGRLELLADLIEGKLDNNED